MTTSELKTILSTMLTAQLGEYASGDWTTPAISEGEPPSAWTVTGLEVVIDVIPELRQVPAYARGAVVETHRVRIISRGALVETHAALRRILARWPTAQARAIPPNERLGVLSQHSITIPA